MLNQVVFVGRLCKEPEVRETETGKKVANITLAVPRSYKNEDGVYDTDFINCTLWNHVAESTAEYCKKGDMIGIKGRIETREIQNDNHKHTENIVVADKVTFLSSSKEKNDDKEMNM